MGTTSTTRSTSLSSMHFSSGPTTPMANLPHEPRLLYSLDNISITPISCVKTLYKSTSLLLFFDYIGSFYIFKMFAQLTFSCSNLTIHVSVLPFCPDITVNSHDEI